MVFPWGWLGVTFGIISLGVCFSMAQSPLSAPILTLYHSYIILRHTNSLPQTSLALFLLQTFTRVFTVPTVFAISFQICSSSSCAQN